MKRGGVLGLILFVSIFCAIFGGKTFQIREYGAALPHWDEWLGEGQTTLKPWLEGRFDAAKLFEAHNEHRIVLTRLLAIGLLKLNDQWDPLLQMVVNAALHALCGALLWLMLFYGRSAGVNGLGAIGVMLAFALPFNWENTLLPFQSQLYLMLLLSILSLWLCCAKAGSVSWFAGLLLMPAAALTQSSGFLAAAAAFVPLSMQVLGARKVSIRIVACGVLLLAILGVGFYFRVEVPWHAERRARSLLEFVIYFAQILGWPLRRLAGFLLSVPQYLPVLALAGVLAFSRHKDRRSLFILSLAVWVIIQAAGTAYARGGGRPAVPSRYTDTLVLGLLANAAAIVVLWRRGGGATVKFLGAGWSAVFFAGLINCTLFEIWHELPPKVRMSGLQIENVRAYVASKDISFLAGKPDLYIPFPFPEMLAGFLDDPVLRPVLPATIAPPIQARENLEGNSAFVQPGTNPFVPLLPAEPIWGSFSEAGEKAIGEFRSEVLPQPRLPYLEVLASGYIPSENMRLELVPEDGSPAISVSPREMPREGWVKVLIESPHSSFHIEAGDQQSDRWLAFASLRELGRYGYLARKLLPWAEWIFLFGLLLPLSSLVYGALYEDT